MTYRPPSLIKVSNLSVINTKTISSTSPLGTTLPFAISIDTPNTNLTPLSGVSFTNGELVLDAGKSYYLQASIVALGLNRPQAGIFEATWYNKTLGSEIGQKYIINLDTSAGGTNQSTQNAERCARWCARALILSGDFDQNQQMTIDLRVLTWSGNSWFCSLEQTSPPAVEGSSQITIWQID